MKLVIALAVIWVAFLAVLWVGMTMSNPVTDRIDPQPNLSSSP